ncbi:MAG: hypothetical protein J6A44_01735 [Paludibacteraceae bacterium]|nr:hypothetical protein [Paludibacteraceae bacterium]
MKIQQEKIVYFIVQCLLFLVSPLLSLILCAIYYKEYVSQFFFVLFAFYFGYQTDVYLDLANHYNSWLYFYNHGVSLYNFYDEMRHLGSEPYHFIMKGLCFFFSKSSRFFGGFFAAVYACWFLTFFNKLRPFYMRKMHYFQMLALCGVVFAVEYYWYLGMRYWAGVFFFLCFYLKYIFTGNRKYLYISCCALLFHFAHIIIIICVLATEFLHKFIKLKYIILLISFVYRFFGDSVVYYMMPRIYFLKGILGSEWYYREESLNSLSNKMLYFREYGNVVYQNRENICLFVLLSIFYLIWRQNKRFYLKFHKLYTFIIYVWCVVNFVYNGGLTLHERVFKFFILLLFLFLFLVLNDERNQKIEKNYFMKGVFILLICFIIATAVVQQREHLFDLSIWVGNLFTLLK